MYTAHIKFLGLISDKNVVVNFSTAACLWRTVLACLLTAFLWIKKFSWNIKQDYLKVC